MKMYYLFFEDSWQNWDGWQDISQEEREKLARVYSDHKNKLMEKLKNEHEICLAFGISHARFLFP